MFPEFTIKEFKGVYQWLSNMAPVKPFTIDGITYNAVENYYQAQKTLAIGRRLEISRMNPYDSKKWGKALTLREDWSSIKDDVMKKGLEVKFAQPKFYNLLANTGISELIEGNNWNDKYWGLCLKTNSGQNKLGQFITEIRTRIFEELDNTPMMIDNYENIKRELSKFDFKHMDKATIRFMQNEFIKNFYEEDAVKLVDELLATISYEEILEESLTQAFHEKSMTEKLRISLIHSSLTEFVDRFRGYIHQTNLTVQIK